MVTDFPPKSEFKTIQDFITFNQRYDHKNEVANTSNFISLTAHNKNLLITNFVPFEFIHGVGDIIELTDLIEITL